MQNRLQTPAEKVFLNPILQGGGYCLSEFSSESSHTKVAIIAEPKNDADAKLVPEVTHGKWNMLSKNYEFIFDFPFVTLLRIIYRASVVGRIPCNWRKFYLRDRRRISL